MWQLFLYQLNMLSVLLPIQVLIAYIFKQAVCLVKFKRHGFLSDQYFKNYLKSTPLKPDNFLYLFL